MMSLRALVSIPVVLLALTACGGTEETAVAGVASASDLDESIQDAAELATEAAAEDGDGEVTAEEAGLALAVCMRESGFEDFPDPEIDENGNVNLRAAITASGVDLQADGFRDQITLCRDEVGADNFGAGNRGEQREAIQEQLLSYTQCLRDEGLDVGDLGAPGEGGQQAGQQGGQQGGQNADGNGAGNGPGRAQGNVGTTEGRGARIAQTLGLDVEDPATAEALEACDDVLVQAFAGVGAGQPAADNN